MNTKILVSGATGNVGAEVVKLLTEQGRPVQAAGRTVAAIQQQFGPAVEAVRLDFADPATFGPAFAGIDRLFLVRPPTIANVKEVIFPAITAAQQAGVRHVVFLSLIGVENNRVVPHYQIEQYLINSGLTYTFLRASFFMQNLNTTHRAEIQKDSEIFVPAGYGRTSFIDVRDIAAVAVVALLETGHANQAYDLTGSEALDYYAVAAILSQVLGRTITYRNPSLLHFVWRQRRQGRPWSFVAVMAGIYTTARIGWAGRVAEETQRLLGRAPIRFEQYAADYRACWLPAANE